MCVTILDIENSITRKTFTSKTSGKVTDYIDNSPYCPTNKLVSVGYECLGEEPEYLFFYHKKLLVTEDNHSKLQAVLDKTKLLVGHNLKYDLQWLLECGFKYNGHIFDTMIFEYIVMKGGNGGLSLEECCRRRGIKTANKHLLSDHYDNGGNTDDMDIDLLRTYGEDDIQITKKLFMNHRFMIRDNKEIRSMGSIVKASHAFTTALIEMERNGFKIDLEELAKIEDQYRKRLAEITPILNQIVTEVMGHTPMNLDSPEQLSQIVFGFKVKDKDAWSEFFNLGQEKEGARAGKTKYKTPRTDKEVAYAIKKWTVPVHKTEACQCKECNGKGYIRKIKKNGELYKKDNKCRGCKAKGIIYKSLPARAGLNIPPLNYNWTASGGFSVGKKSITYIAEAGIKISPKAKQFVELLQEYSAITVYLTAFIEGIQKKITPDGLLHMNYNQCITKTGRLSSSFHNFPRGKTFPIKRAIHSRWVGGKIINIDAGQLEFRVAVLLANDQVGIADIKNNIDVHLQTSTIMTQYGQDTDRQTAKSFTFGPLYGKVLGNEVEKKYYDWFLDKYKAIRDWQVQLGQSALYKKQIYSPSGRIYSFPSVKKLRDGRVTQFTQICNYCVQGFSFDVIMAAIIEVNMAMKEAKLKSKLCINVHDSAVIDCFPGEEEKVLKITKSVLDNMSKLIVKWYPAANDNVPIAFDYSIGNNWYEQEKVA